MFTLNSDRHDIFTSPLDPLDHSMFFQKTSSDSSAKDAEHDRGNSRCFDLVNAELDERPSRGQNVTRQAGPYEAPRVSSYLGF